MEAVALFERRIKRIQRLLTYATIILAIFAIAACFVAIDEKYQAVGKVTPRDESVVYALEDTSVKTLHVRAGDRVTTGQVLMDLSTEDCDVERLGLVNDAERLDAEIAAQEAEKEKVVRNPLSADFRHINIETGTAEARVKHYEEYLGMLDTLTSEGIVSKLEYKQAKLAQIQAQADLKRDQADQSVLKKGYMESVIRGAQAQVRLLQTTRKAVDRKMGLLNEKCRKRQILAPAAGLVTVCEKRDPGEPVKKGEVLYRIALSDGVMLQLSGPEQNFNRVSPGQPVRIESLVFSPYKFGYARGEVLKVAKEAEEKLAFAAQGQTATPSYRILCSVTKMPKGQHLPLGSSVIAKITLRRSNLLFILLGWGNRD